VEIALRTGPTMTGLDSTSKLVAEYRTSVFARIWRLLWRWFPSFSAKHSPFFIFDDGAVLWNQGLGQLAFLKGDRSVTIGWDFAERSIGRILHVTAVRHWDPPHDAEQITDSERLQLIDRLRARFEARNERIVIR
jgi:hypothetical protein